MEVLFLAQSIVSCKFDFNLQKINKTTVVTNTFALFA